MRYGYDILSSLLDLNPTITSLQYPWWPWMKECIYRQIFDEIFGNLLEILAKK
jgi:hypothetical protein